MIDNLATKKPKVLVIHRGSRRRYAVPRLLEKSGYLAGFYTDSHRHSPLGKVANLIPEYLRSSSVQRLYQRQIEDIPLSKVKGWDSLTFYDWQFNRSKLPLKTWLEKRDELWLRKLKHWGLGDANVLYSMSAENLSALEYVSKQGIRTVVDAFIDPGNVRIMREEKIKFNLPLNRFEAEWEIMEQHYAQIYSQADYILCPANSVAEGVKEVCPDTQKPIWIVPYGSSLNFNDNKRSPVNGRILWAGTDWLRKGLIYLAKAADQLKPYYPHLDIRVAGVIDENLMRDTRFQNLTFLGRLDKQKFMEELLSAQIFTLPTLVEGMAGVVIEALSAGLPCIITEQAGIDGAEDKENVLIVPSQNSIALVEAIKNLLTNSELSDYLSHQSKKLAQTFTEDLWEKRLTDAINQINMK